MFKKIQNKQKLLPRWQLPMTSWIWNMSTITTKRPVRGKCYQSSMRLMPCTQIHMPKVPMQEPLGSVLPLEDTLCRQVRLWRGRTHLHLSPRYGRKYHNSARTLSIPTRKPYSLSLGTLDLENTTSRPTCNTKIQINTLSKTNTTQHIKNTFEICNYLSTENITLQLAKTNISALPLKFWTVYIEQILPFHFISISYVTIPCKILPADFCSFATISRPTDDMSINYKAICQPYSLKLFQDHSTTSHPFSE